MIDARLQAGGHAKRPIRVVAHAQAVVVPEVGNNCPFHLGLMSTCHHDNGRGRPSGLRGEGDGVFHHGAAAKNRDLLGPTEATSATGGQDHEATGSGWRGGGHTTSPFQWQTHLLPNIKPSESYWSPWWCSSSNVWRMCTRVETSFMRRGTDAKAGPNSTKMKPSASLFGCQNPGCCRIPSAEEGTEGYVVSLLQALGVGQ